jgi:tetratricopeptide (TPR) repeat protein
VRVEPGDTINSLAVKLADLVEPATTPDESLRIAREIQSLSPSDCAKRFSRDASQALGFHELVILYDDGGLLDSDACPTPAVEAVLAAMKGGSDLGLVLATNRRPRFVDVDGRSIPVVEIHPLRDSEVRQLLAMKARAANLEISASRISTLATKTHGYPPAVTAIVELAKSYGPDLVMDGLLSGNQDYQPRPLTRYLTSLKLNALERRLLAILARNSPLPLEIIAGFAPSGSEAVASLTKLIDASLVIPQSGSSWYTISDPVADFIGTTLPSCSLEDYAVLSRKLERFLAGHRDEGAYVELSRVFYRALVHAGEETRPRAYALMADWLRLAADFYHDRNYEKALELAQTAYESSPSREALCWVIRAQVKLGQFELGLSNIDTLRATLGDVTEAQYLRGFLERNRGDHREAAKHYVLALRSGRGGVSLHRDLADCYFQLGDMESASRHIEEAQSKQSDNPYVLSLRIKIACRLADKVTAYALLPILEKVDKPVFAAHRRSRVELAFGDPLTAHEYALKAVESSTRPPGEALANLAHCQILIGETAEALKTLSRLEQIEKNRRSDVLNGLRASAAIQEKRFEDALGYCVELKGSAPVHARLKHDALKGLLEHAALSPEERQEKEALLAGLERRLKELGVVEAGGSSDLFWDLLEES